MKMIRLATIAALTTTILAGGASAFADEVRGVDTDGQVIFVPNDEDKTVVEPTEPEGPDVEIPPVGSFSMTSAPSAN